ncbi:MAG: hypothetical protein LBR37_04490, partial [Erysipelotrichaceae bacterium]|nr:hypothetical protein [Erysipelotrichaceae bacterium]
MKKVAGIIIKCTIDTQNDEAPAYSHYVVVQDSLTGKEIALTVLNCAGRAHQDPLTNKWEIGPDPHVLYNFIYLKHTKLAVIDDTQLVELVDKDRKS